MKYLIAYDIKNSKKRKKIADELEGIGYRVNLSVFELDLSKARLKKLLFDLSKHLDPSTDSLRFYRVCANCLENSFELCQKASPFQAQNFVL